MFVREKIDELIGAVTHADVSARIILSRDAKDDHYLSLCREIEAEFLISQNTVVPAGNEVHGQGDGIVLSGK